MSIPKTTTFLVVLTLFLCFFTKKTFSQEYDLNTSLDVLWPAPEVEKPGYLEDYTDPVFNTKVTRISGDEFTPIPNISGEVWPDISRHGYSTRQPWNADESLLWLEFGRHSDGSDYIGGMFFDGQTYAPLSDDNDIPSANEVRWHPTDPNLMLLLRDDEIATWNYYTDQVTSLMSFNGYSDTSTGNTGNWTMDGNMVAMYCERDSDGKQVMFAVDTENNIKYPDIDMDDVEIAHISISPLGNYILVKGNFGEGSDRGKVYDLNGNQVGPYWSSYGRPSHEDIAIDQNGDEVAVGVSKSDPNKGKLIKRRLSDGLVTEVTVGGWPPHTSARAINRPGWAITWTSTSSNHPPYTNEVIAVKLDGTRVERICNIRSTFDTYLNETQAVASPSGSRVMFASDWNSGTYPIQAYVADFRDLLIPDGFTVNAGDDVDICEGAEDEVTLTATESETYTWTNNITNDVETTQSINVLPTETTIYTVTATDADGNEASDTVTITVNPLPEANADGDVEICEDESVSISASGGDTYLWEWNGNSQSGQTISVSPQETTTYTVTVTLNGCQSTDEVTVTVKPRPVINAGNDVDIYQGESTTLTAVGEGTFEWSTGETTESISVSPNVTTDYTVTATLNGCTSSDSVLVTVIEPETVVANAGEDTTICLGESVTLTATGGDEYLWSTGETTQSIEVSPSETTSYTVTVTSSIGSDDDDVMVTVNPIPIANAGDDLSIFHGESVTLTASGGTDYLWSTGETTQSIMVNPTEDTTYTVEVIENGCSDFDEVMVYVSVNANTSGDVAICVGDYTTLYANGGTNYLWNTGETTQSIEVNPSQTTTYSVVVSNGTSSDEASLTVTVNLLPNANAGEDVTIESGQNVTLSASGGNSYVWSTGETSQNISVSPTETTTYTVETIINGCSNYDDVTVTVVAVVNAYAGEDTDICIGESVTLTASGGEYFEWSTGETTQSIDVLPLETTTYSVTVSNGISSQVAEVTVIVDSCTDDNLEQSRDFDYRVYPNPSNGEFNIKLSGLEKLSSIYVTDLLGKTVMTEIIQPNDGLIINKTYNLSSLSKGVYFVTFIQSGEDSITKKLLIQ